jgi:hypothetical protein
MTCPLLAESNRGIRAIILDRNLGPQYPPPSSSSLGVSRTCPAKDDTVEQQRDTAHDWLRSAQRTLIYSSIATLSTTLKGLQIQALGPPHLQIYRAALPFDVTHMFARLVQACEAHASRRCRTAMHTARSLYMDDTPYANTNGPLSLNGWETNLYSLTKQDMAVADVPGGLELVAGIQDYVKATIRHVYRHHGPLYLDRNQPHVLKYDLAAGGGGGGGGGGGAHGASAVPLHHDRCHGTFFSRHCSFLAPMLLVSVA